MQDRSKTDPFEPLKEELENYSQKGVRLLLQGKPSNPWQIAKAYKVSEPKCTYMRDYIPNDEGKLEKIDFNRVRCDNKTKKSYVSDLREKT